MHDDVTKNRCSWVGDSRLMLEYHDREWRVPVHDDRKHFEFLVLEASQAGLSWTIVLKKREGYRIAFATDSGDLSRIRRIQQRPQASWIQFCWFDRNVCTHAGGGNGERSSRRLFPLREIRQGQ